MANLGSNDTDVEGESLNVGDTATDSLGPNDQNATSLTGDVDGNDQSVDNLNGLALELLSQVQHSAFIFASQPQTIANDTTTVIEYNTQRDDPLGSLDTNDNSWSPNTDGIYYCHAEVTLRDTGGSGGNTRVRYDVDGDTQIGNSYRAHLGDDWYGTPAGQIIELSSSESLKVDFRQRTGASGDTAAGFEHTRLLIIPLSIDGVTLGN